MVGLSGIGSAYGEQSQVKCINWCFEKTMVHSVTSWFLQHFPGTQGLFGLQVTLCSRVFSVYWLLKFQQFKLVLLGSGSWFGTCCIFSTIRQGTGLYKRYCSYRTGHNVFGNTSFSCIPRVVCYRCFGCNFLDGSLRGRIIRLVINEKGCFVFYRNGLL